MTAAPMKHVHVFAALGDRTRLELVDRLSRSEGKSITQLASGLNLTRQAVTKHLRVLERADVVSHTRVGRESRFEIQPETIKGAQAYLQQASAQWDEVIARIRATVES